MQFSNDFLCPIDDRTDIMRFSETPDQALEGDFEIFRIFF
jgi:hypothetical protein